MTGRPVNLRTWPRAEQFRLFRAYERPHYAITTRIDATRLMAARAEGGLSPFRAVIYAIGAGLHAVPELRMRFRDTRVTLYDRLLLSPAVPLDNGAYGYTYLAWLSDRAAFDAHAKERIDEVRTGQTLNANDGSIEDVAYLSCLPWLDYTALDNAMPDANDCIPRISWGKIVPKGEGHDMAMTIQVHHALVDGRHVGQFFEATAAALDDIP